MTRDTPVDKSRRAQVDRFGGRDGVTSSEKMDCNKRSDMDILADGLYGVGLVTSVGPKLCIVDKDVFIHPKLPNYWQLGLGDSVRLWVKQNRKRVSGKPKLSWFAEKVELVAKARSRAADSLKPRGDERHTGPGDMRLDRDSHHLPLHHEYSVRGAESPCFDMSYIDTTGWGKHRAERCEVFEGEIRGQGRGGGAHAHSGARDRESDRCTGEWSVSDRDRDWEKTRSERLWEDREDFGQESAELRLQTRDVDVEYRVEQTLRRLLLERPGIVDTYAARDAERIVPQRSTADWDDFRERRAELREGLEERKGDARQRRTEGHAQHDGKRDGNASWEDRNQTIDRNGHAERHASKDTEIKIGGDLERDRLSDRHGENSTEGSRERDREKHQGRRGRDGSKQQERNSRKDIHSGKRDESGKWERNRHEGSHESRDSPRGQHTDGHGSNERKDRDRSNVRESRDSPRGEHAESNEEYERKYREDLNGSNDKSRDDSRVGMDRHVREVRRGRERDSGGGWDKQRDHEHEDRRRGGTGRDEDRHERGRDSRDRRRESVGNRPEIDPEHKGLHGEIKSCRLNGFAVATYENGDIIYEVYVPTKATHRLQLSEGQKIVMDIIPCKPDQRFKWRALRVRRPGTEVDRWGDKDRVGWGREHAFRAGAEKRYGGGSRREREPRPDSSPEEGEISSAERESRNARRERRSQSLFSQEDDLGEGEGERRRERSVGEGKVSPPRPCQRDSASSRIGAGQPIEDDRPERKRRKKFDKVDADPAMDAGTDDVGAAGSVCADVEAEEEGSAFALAGALGDVCDGAEEDSVAASGSCSSDFEVDDEGTISILAGTSAHFRASAEDSREDRDAPAVEASRSPENARECEGSATGSEAGKMSEKVRVSRRVSSPHDEDSMSLCSVDFGSEADDDLRNLANHSDDNKQRSALIATKSGNGVLKSQTENGEIAGDASAAVGDDTSGTHASVGEGAALDLGVEGVAASAISMDLEERATEVSAAIDEDIAEQHEERCRKHPPALDVHECARQSSIHEPVCLSCYPAVAAEEESKEGEILPDPKHLVHGSNDFVLGHGTDEENRLADSVPEAQDLSHSAAAQEASEMRAKEVQKQSGQNDEQGISVQILHAFDSAVPRGDHEEDNCTSEQSVVERIIHALGGSGSHRYQQKAASCEKGVRDRERMHVPCVQGADRVLPASDSVAQQDSQDLIKGMRSSGQAIALSGSAVPLHESQRLSEPVDMHSISESSRMASAETESHKMKEPRQKQSSSGDSLSPLAQPSKDDLEQNVGFVSLDLASAVRLEATHEESVEKVLKDSSFAARPSPDSALLAQEHDVSQMGGATATEGSLEIDQSELQKTVDKIVVVPSVKHSSLPDSGERNIMQPNSEHTMEQPASQQTFEKAAPEQTIEQPASEQTVEQSSVKQFAMRQSTDKTAKQSVAQQNAVHASDCGRDIVEAFASTFSDGSVTEAFASSVEQDCGNGLETASDVEIRSQNDSHEGILDQSNKSVSDVGKSVSLQSDAGTASTVESHIEQSDMTKSGVGESKTIESYVEDSGMTVSDVGTGSWAESREKKQDGTSQRTVPEAEKERSIASHCRKSIKKAFGTGEGDMNMFQDLGPVKKKGKIVISKILGSVERKGHVGNSLKGGVKEVERSVTFYTKSSQDSDVNQVERDMAYYSSILGGVETRSADKDFQHLGSDCVQSGIEFTQILGGVEAKRTYADSQGANSDCANRIVADSRILGEDDANGTDVNSQNATLNASKESIGRVKGKSKRISDEGRVSGGQKGKHAAGGDLGAASNCECAPQGATTIDSEKGEEFPDEEDVYSITGEREKAPHGGKIFDSKKNERLLTKGDLTEIFGKRDSKVSKEKNHSASRCVQKKPRTSDSAEEGRFQAKADGENSQGHPESDRNVRDSKQAAVDTHQKEGITQTDRAEKVLKNASIDPSHKEKVITDEFSKASARESMNDTALGTLQKGHGVPGKIQKASTHASTKNPALTTLQKEPSVPGKTKKASAYESAKNPALATLQKEPSIRGKTQGESAHSSNDAALATLQQGESASKEAEKPDAAESNTDATLEQGKSTLKEAVKSVAVGSGTGVALQKGSIAAMEKSQASTLGGIKGAGVRDMQNGNTAATELSQASAQRSCQNAVIADLNKSKKFSKDPKASKAKKVSSGVKSVPSPDQNIVAKSMLVNGQVAKSKPDNNTIVSKSTPENEQIVSTSTSLNEKVAIKSALVQKAKRAAGTDDDIDSCWSVKKAKNVPSQDETVNIGSTSQGVLSKSAPGHEISTGHAHIVNAAQGLASDGQNVNLPARQERDGILEKEFCIEKWKKRMQGMTEEAPSKKQKIASSWMVFTI